MAEIKIKVGAAADTSLRGVFKPLIQAAKDARKQVAREFANLQKEMAGSFAGAATASRKSFKGTQAEVTGATKAIVKEVDNAGKEMAKSWDRSASFAERAMKREWSTYASEQKKALREAERTQAQHARTIEKFAERTSYRATRFLMPNAPIASMARRAASGILQGLGVDTSLSGSVGRSVALDKQARALSNQGYIAGAAGPNGQRQDASSLIGDARSLAKAQSMDSADVMGGLEKFTTITGDLETARKIMGDMAVISGATNSNFEDIMSAAANASTNLEPGVDKAKRLGAIMRVIAGQGKLGAVEMKDMSKYMAIIAAAAPGFEGDVGSNIVKLGALAQIARQTGGAASPVEAVRAVGGFANTLQKSARVKAFAKAGVDVFTNDKHTTFKDPFELIREALTKTGGKKDAMNALFANVIGAKAVTGLTNRFNQAGGGAEGLKAVDSYIQTFMKGAALSEDELKESNKRRMESDAAKAQKFQESLDAVIAKMLSGVIPAFERLEPKVLELVESFSRVVTWASENPGRAIALAVGVSIARAGLESTLRHGIESVFKGLSGTGGVGGKGAPGFMGGMGLLSNLAAGLTIATLAVTTLEAGKMVISEFFDEQKKRQNEGALGGVQAAAAVANAHRAIEEQGALDPENKSALEAAQLALQKKITDAETFKSRYQDNEKGQQSAMTDTALAAMGIGNGLSSPQTAQFDLHHLQELKDQMSQVRSLLGDIKEGTLSVRIEGGPPPGTAPGGFRTGHTVDHF